MSDASASLAAIASTPLLPRRVGIVMPLAEQRGGAELALLHYLRGLDPAERSAVSLAFFETGPLLDQCLALGYRVAVVDTGRIRRPLQWLRAVRVLRRWLLREQVTVLMSWMHKAHVYGGPAAWLGRVPAVWWQHGLPVRRGLDLLATWMPARLTVACSNAAAGAQRRMPGQRAALRVIHPPVDLASMRSVPDTGASRRQLGLPEDRPIIGILARLQHWKGVHIFMEAAAKLRAGGHRALFLVVGGPHALEPGYEAFLARRAQALGFGADLRLCGHQVNAPLWMSAMDIVVNASFGEPFGMTLIEAMALGKPVVATNSAGPAEIITDEVSGLLVPSGDSPALARALARLLDEPALRQRLAAAGRERAAHFALPRFVAEVNAMLAEQAA